MAARPVKLTPLGNLAIPKEDRRSLEMGGSPRHWDALGGESPSRSRHLIGNPEGARLETRELQAKTAFLVYRSPLQTDQQLLSGCRKDVRRSGAWEVRRRTIVLDANVLLARTSASSSMGQNLISVMPLTAKRALAKIDHNGT